MVAAATIEGIENSEISQFTSFFYSNRDGLKKCTSWAVPGDGDLFFDADADADADGDGAISEALNCRTPNNGSSGRKWDRVGAQENS
ncbi:hypothetical protein KUW09_20700 [Mameliella alba]|nr:hypothetical protein [Antarctobacter heliothermus]MBY6146484.1 hypothetical protein [Mameliella alba]MBY6162712.1 hypothetical protein [Mameliella alba]MBY6170975.1 hypothetical protein [Mameliella alba]MBY6176199.1 hypothetical protein [Mameliella alba]